MAISARLAAELSILSQTLENPGNSIAQSMQRLSDEISDAVESYLGLTVTIAPGTTPITFTTLRDGAQPASVRTSARFTLTRAAAGSVGTGPVISLIVYAATPGAFVDLAADLAWITRANPAHITLDQDLTVVFEMPTTAPSAVAMINQAIGVLIGRGHSPEQAYQRLSRPSASGVVNRLDAAAGVLASLDPNLESEFPIQ